MNDEKFTILVADHNSNNLKVLLEALTGFGYDVRVATNGQEAVESALAKAPDLILMDINMPEMDGYEACRMLKKNPSTNDIPVIFVSAMDEDSNKLKAFESGAVDYISKPIHIEEARARVNVHLKLCEKIRELKMFNKIMLDREMRIVELKKEINQLARETGTPLPYPEIWKS